MFLKNKKFIILSELGILFSEKSNHILIYFQNILPNILSQPVFLVVHSFTKCQNYAFVLNFVKLGFFTKNKKLDLYCITALNQINPKVIFIYQLNHKF